MSQLTQYKNTFCWKNNIKVIIQHLMAQKDPICEKVSPKAVKLPNCEIILKKLYDYHADKLRMWDQFFDDGLYFVPRLRPNFGDFRSWRSHHKTRSRVLTEGNITA